MILSTSNSETHHVFFENRQQLGWYLIVALTLASTFVLANLACAVLKSTILPLDAKKIQAQATIKRLNDNPDVIFIGTSHTQFSLYPQWTPNVKTVSIGRPSGDYTIIEAILNTHWDKIKHSKAIAIEFDHFPFYQNLIERFPHTTNLPSLGIHPLNFPCPIYRRISIYIHLLPIFTQPKLTPQIFQNWFHRRNSLNSLPLFLSSRRVMFERGRARAEIHVLLANKYGPTSLKNNEEAFARIINKAHDAGLKVFLVKYPHVDEYWDYLSEQYVNHFRNKEAELRDSPKVTIIEPPIEWQYEDFRDGDHLNRWGAHKFSMFFNEYLVQQLGLPTTPDSKKHKAVTH